MVALISISVVLIFCPSVSAAESNLAIVQAGVQDAEDSPFVAQDFEFRPGESVHFTFLISGFRIKSEDAGNIQRISLAYDVTAMDANGVALAPPDAGKVSLELSAEDKNWLPKRRAVFAIPSFLAAGDFHIHVEVKDLFAQTSASRDFPFHVGGIHLKPADGLTVEDFRFLRREDDREPLELAAYGAGDTVYVQFVIAGFQYGSQNHYHVTYGLTVIGPDGKPYLQQEKAAELEADSFYPAQFVPGNLNLTTTREAARGQYAIVLEVHDLTAHRDVQSRQTFRVE